jgi:hypothetical protein
MTLTIVKRNTVDFIIERQCMDQAGGGVLPAAENDNCLFSHGSFFLGMPPDVSRGY